METLKNILIVFTGGTFSMKIDEDTGGAVPHFSGSDLIELIPGINENVNVSIYDFGKYPGPHMTPQLMLELSQRIKTLFQPGIMMELLLLTAQTRLKKRLTCLI